MTEEPPPQGEIVLYQTADGSTRVECRFAEETLWLSQLLIAELFQKDVRTINEHLKNIFEEGELGIEATLRKFRIVRQEGQRQVSRQIDHYNLDAILAVGYRVRSPQGTQFRTWATERLREYLVKGLALAYPTTSTSCWSVCTCASERSSPWPLTTRQQRLMRRCSSRPFRTSCTSRSRA